MLRLQWLLAVSPGQLLKSGHGLRPKRWPSIRRGTTTKNMAAQAMPLLKTTTKCGSCGIVWATLHTGASSMQVDEVTVGPGDGTRALGASGGPSATSQITCPGTRRPGRGMFSCSQQCPAQQFSPFLELPHHLVPCSGIQHSECSGCGWQGVRPPMLNGPMLQHVLLQ